MNESEIIFVTKSSQVGGEAVVIQKLYSTLTKKGLKIKVLSLMDTQKIINKDFYFLEPKLIFGKEFPSKKDNFAIKKIFTDNSNKKLIQHFIFDIRSIIYFIKIKRYGGNHIITFHTNMDNFGFIKFFNVVLSKILFINLFLFSVKKIIFITATQKQSFKKFCLFKKTFDNKSIIINNFIDSKLIKKSNTPRKNKRLKVMYIGRLTELKGFEDLIKVINEIDTDVTFTIIGDGKLKGLIPKRKTVNHLNYVANKELFLYYGAHEILILPSYSETFGMVILEAMARGLVVLASDLPAIREYFVDGRNGYLFPPGDTKKMKELIIYLKNNPKEIERISKNNLKDIWKFTAEKQIPKYMEVYGEVLKENNTK